jgi:site-specific DNA-methyltransferase (adenine-specific)
MTQTATLKRDEYDEPALPIDTVINGDSVPLLKQLPSSAVHLILSDIPYGIGAEDWDVLHDNTNSAF